MGNLFSRNQNISDLNKDYLTKCRFDVLPFLTKSHNLITHARKCQSKKNFKEALSALNCAIEILAFTGKYVVSKQTDRDLIQREMVISIRNTIILAAIIKEIDTRSINLSNTESDLIRTSAKQGSINRLTPQEALEVLIEGKPEDDVEILSKLTSTIQMDVPNVHWDDIVGLSTAKTALIEAIVYPTQFKQANFV